MSDDLLELVRRCARARVDDDPAATPDPGRRDEHRASTRSRDEHAIAGRHAERGERAGEPRRIVVQYAISPRPLTNDECVVGPATFDVLVPKRCDIHRYS